MAFTRSHRFVRAIAIVHPASERDGTCLTVVPRATACAAEVAWLSHKRRLRRRSVVVADPVVEVVYGGGNSRSTEARSKRRRRRTASVRTGIVEGPRKK